MSNGTHCGKKHLGIKGAFIPYADKEVNIENYQVLDCRYEVKWHDCKNYK